MAKSHHKEGKTAVESKLKHTNGIKHDAVDKKPLKDSKKSEKSKARSPSPESEIDSGSDSDVESEADSESGSDESDDSGVSEKAAPVKVNGNGKSTNVTANKDDSEGSDDSSESSGSESDSEAEKPASSKAAPTVGSKAAAEASSDDSDSNSDESDESPAKAGTTPKVEAVNGADASAPSDEDSDSGSSEGSEGSNSDSDSGSDTGSSPPKKRKAEAIVDEAAGTKKQKKIDGTAGTKVTQNGIKNLFVGNLSWNVDTEWLSREFADFGELVDVRIVTDRDSGRSKGFGYVEFADADAAAKAHEGKGGSMLDGRPLNVDFATPRGDKNSGDRGDQRAKKFGDSKSSPSDTLWIGNIPFSATAEMIQDVFGQFGSIVRVSLPTDRATGALKGFGYVGFSSIDEAQAAIDNSSTLSVEGRPLRLDFAGPRPDNGGGDSGGFRGGRGGDRGGRGRGGRGGRGGDRGGRGRGGFRGNSTNRGGMNDFKGQKIAF